MCLDKGGVGRQTLTWNDSGSIALTPAVGNDPLVNAALLLGTTAAASTPAVTNRIASKIRTVAGNISRLHAPTGTFSARVRNTMP